MAGLPPTVEAFIGKMHDLLAEIRNDEVDY